MMEKEGLFQEVEDVRGGRGASRHNVLHPTTENERKLRHLHSPNIFLFLDSQIHSHIHHPNSRRRSRSGEVKGRYHIREDRTGLDESDGEDALEFVIYLIPHLRGPTQREGPQDLNVFEHPRHVLRRNHD